MSGHIADSDAIDWTTPKFIVDLAHELWGGIDLDPCSNAGSIVGAKHTFTLPDQDGLKERWALRGTTCFVNSPFGTYLMSPAREILMPKEYRRIVKHGTDAEKADLIASGPWVSHSIADWRAKCVEAAEDGASVLQLGPANVDTVSWHKHVEGTADAVLYFRGRLTFRRPDGTSGAAAPMPCALALWGHPITVDEFQELGAPYGAVHILRRSRG